MFMARAPRCAYPGYQRMRSQPHSHVNSCTDEHTAANQHLISCTDKHTAANQYTSSRTDGHTAANQYELMKELLAIRDEARG